jgi:hypothetical protein
MNGKIVTIWDELVRISTLLLPNMYSDNFFSLLVDHSFDLSYSDLVCLYLTNDLEMRNTDLVLEYKRGNHKAAKILAKTCDFVTFLSESNEALILAEPPQEHFLGMLLTKEMKSGVALNLGFEKKQYAVLILNSLNIGHYSKECCDFFNTLARLAGVMLAYRFDKRMNKNENYAVGSGSGSALVKSLSHPNNKDQGENYG